MTPAAKPSRAAVVLAAGRGTRFRSSLAKVLHPVAGRSMLRWVLEALRPLALDSVVVVVGHQAAAVAAEAQASGLPGLRTVEQTEQHGTGHAVRVAVEQGALDAVDEVLITPGDVPLLEHAVLADLLAAAAGHAAALLSFTPADPGGYGRVLRDEAGRVTGIVEDRDASAEQRRIGEVNSGICAFARAPLAAALGELARDNVQGEEYLTDVIAPLAAAGVTAVPSPAGTLDGVNDRVQLAEAGAVLRRRILERLMYEGVSVVDPAATYVDADVRVGPDTILRPGTHLEGATVIGAGADIGPDTRLMDATVGDGASVAQSVVRDAVVGAQATVGPFSYLRAGTDLGARGKIGAYVETKQATVGEGAKVPHLSYVGDAEIGAGANIGAATVTANYDGFAKHRTVIGPRARIGSDTMLIAPVTVGADAYTGAGSVITDDVPDGALALSRSEQRTIEGYAARKAARHAGKGEA